MPTAYCSIADAYGDDFGKPKNFQKTLTGPPTTGPPTKDPYHCPYCNHCNQANNVFQQKVIDQAIGPRPQWYPPEEVGPWRRFQRREYFGDPQLEHLSQGNTESMLRVILWLLIALFTIQLVDMIIKVIST